MAQEAGAKPLYASGLGSRNAALDNLIPIDHKHAAKNFEETNNCQVFYSGSCHFSLFL